MGRNKNPTKCVHIGFGLIFLLLGFLGGKLVGFLLSLFTLFRGLGYLDVSYLPLSFVLIILFLSIFVGIVTGIYPARRATKISALNALRYE
jgi:putative ABC transport system permease protein